MPKAYQQYVDLDTPGCVLLVLDQSWVDSNEQSFAANAIAEYANSWILRLGLICSTGESVRNYFHVGALGYCTRSNGAPVIGSAFCGPLRSLDPLLPIRDIFNNPAGLFLEDRTHFDEESGESTPVQIEKLVWIHPVAAGWRPTDHAFSACHDILQAWCEQHPNCLPPLVVHFTTGLPTDTVTERYARLLCSLRTDYGNLILANCFVSCSSDEEDLLFPATINQLRSREARFFFRISSPLPEATYGDLRLEGFDNVDEKSRFMTVNHSGLPGLTSYFRCIGDCVTPTTWL